jgi:hypothetical protein
VLDWIRYLAENGLTSLMVLHNFLSKRLVRPSGLILPHVDVHQDERHHAAGPWAWVELG